MPYDFRRPNKFSREHIRALQIVSETFARQLSTVFATTLRAVSSVQVGPIEQRTYDEYIGSLPNPTHLTVLALPPLPGSALMQLPLPIAMAAVDRLLGGMGDSGDVVRPPTEIEDHLIGGMLDRAMRELSYAFESLVHLEAAITRTEHNPQFAQIGAPSDMVIVIEFEMKIGDERGRATLALPYDTVFPVLETISNAQNYDRDTNEMDSFSHRLHDALRAVPVDVSVRFHPVVLGTRDILALATGDVIPLGQPVDEPLTVMVDGLPMFTAVTGRRGKRVACLVTGDIESESA